MNCGNFLDNHEAFRGGVLTLGIGGVRSGIQ